MEVRKLLQDGNQLEFYIMLHTNVTNVQMFISKLKNKTNHFKEKYLIPHDGYFFNYVLIYVVTL